MSLIDGSETGTTVGEEQSMTGLYLTFELASEGYGLEICYVTEIIGIQPVIVVPGMPPHVIGVLNLRGKVIPIIDVRLRFALARREYDERTCIIVVNVNDYSVGLVVDKVSEVVTIDSHQIEPPPATGRGLRQYIRGMGKLDHRVRMLIDVEALITEETDIHDSAPPSAECNTAKS